MSETCTPPSPAYLRELAGLSAARGLEALERIDAGRELPGQFHSADPHAYQLGYLKGTVRAMAAAIDRMLEVTA